MYQSYVILKENQKVISIAINDVRTEKNIIYCWKTKSKFEIHIVKKNEDRLNHKNYLFDFIIPPNHKKYIEKMRKEYSNNKCIPIPQEYKKYFHIFVHDLGEYLRVLELMDLKDPVFRGQGNKNWELQAGIKRLNQSESLYKNIWHVFYRQKSSEKIYNDFMDAVVKMQHYGIPTDLLDWSYNSLIGLYFASEPDSETDKYDGKVFVSTNIKPYPADSTMIKEIETLFENKYTKDEIAIKESRMKILRKLNYNSFIFFETNLSNDRIKAQQGIFSMNLDIDINSIREDIIDQIKEKIWTESVRRNHTDAEYDLQVIISNIKKNKDKRAFLDNIEEQIQRKYENDSADFTYMRKFIDYLKDPRTRIFFSEDRSDRSVNSSVNFEIIIPKERKKMIIETLQKVCGIRASSVYPDDVGLAKYIKTSIVQRS